jgi:hypothetical protein
VNKTVVLLLVSVALLTGCATATPPENDVDAGELALEEALSAPVLGLEVGTCVNDADTPLSADIAEVPTVSCQEPHDSELYALIPVADGAYPGADQLIEQGQRGCQSEFGDFVGIDFRSSLLDFYFYYPTPSSWAAGDRLIYCMVFDPGMQVKGTLEDAKR